MVGICGIVGDDAPLPEQLIEGISGRDCEYTTARRDDGLRMTLSLHPPLAGRQPASTRDGRVDVYVWGDVYGHGPRGTYTPRPDGVPSARYCARLYDRYGIRFVDDLNGDFLLVLHDESDGTVTFVTDRVATRPVYYAETDSGFVFSSHLQSLPTHPAVPAAFDDALLHEYLLMRRVLGVETPLEGVRELPPGSIVEVDAGDGSVRTDTYWRPSYDPEDRPLSYFVDEFTDVLRQVLGEWTRDDREYGVLLSGGSDSRLVQAAMDVPVTAFHIADWMSREATVARRAARAAGDEFVMLRRDDSYYERTLEQAPSMSAFSGWFDQAYFTGVQDELTGRVDVLVSGLYADMLFAGSGLQTTELSLGDVGTLSVPLHREVNSIEEYAEAVTNEAPDHLPYSERRESATDIVLDHVHTEGRHVVSHGVRYNSLCDLMMYGDFYPMSADTDAIFSRSLGQTLPYRTPFLDNRLLDLQQRIPIEYLLRRNIVNRALTKIAPDLAEIPHARTGIPPKYPFVVDYVGGNLNGFRRKHVFEESPPQAHLDHGPWPNRPALVRETDLVFDSLRSNERLVDAAPSLDYERAVECYRAHEQGANNAPVLYSLVTLLEMPVTRQVYGAADEGRDSMDASAGQLPGSFERSVTGDADG